MNRIAPQTAYRLGVIAMGLSFVLPIGLGAQEEIERGPLPPAPDVTYHPDPEGVEVETFATGLEIVWKLEFAPDGRMFLTERPGRIRTISADGALDPEAWVSVEDRTLNRGESGLMGLALHPDFEAEPWVYVMYTVDEGDEVFNRVSRFPDVDGRGGAEEVLLDYLPAQEGGGNHSGGTLAFGPDGMLYVAVGDTFERALAASLDDLEGSLLRLTPSGEVPADNPWPGNPIWAYGFRNVHGIAWHPGSDRMFAADHGPTGEDGLRHLDRVIVVEAGAHHGWPAVVGAPGHEEYVDPILVFDPAAPPGDIVFLDDELFMSILGFTPAAAQALLRVRFDDPSDPFRPTVQERWFHDAEGNSVYGRLRGMTVGPDGALYVGTSNRDGRGQVRDGDDRILRIMPRQ